MSLGLSRFPQPNSNSYNKPLAPFGEPINANHPEVPTSQSSPISQFVLDVVARMKDIGADLVRKTRSPNMSLLYQAAASVSEVNTVLASLTARHQQVTSSGNANGRRTAGNGEQQQQPQPMETMLTKLADEFAATASSLKPASGTATAAAAAVAASDTVEPDGEAAEADDTTEDSSSAAGSENASEDDSGQVDGEEPDENCKEEDCSDLTSLDPSSSMPPLYDVPTGDDQQQAASRFNIGRAGQMPTTSIGSNHLPYGDSTAAREQSSAGFIATNELYPQSDPHTISADAQYGPNSNLYSSTGSSAAASTTALSSANYLLPVIAAITMALASQLQVICIVVQQAAASNSHLRNSRAQSSS